MSSLVQPLVTWEAFLALPDPSDTGNHHELHDGEVVEVPPPHIRHVKQQKRLERLLEAAAVGHVVAVTEYPYRPAENLQYWVADLAFIPQSDWDALPLDTPLPIYSPALIVEVLSPSNRPAKTNRQRLVAMSGGTREFWIVDMDAKSILVTDLTATMLYRSGDVLPATSYHAAIAVDDVFAI